MPANNKINYVEFAAKDLAATKAFFSKVFNWSFEDYGEEYSAFTGEGLDGGFYAADKATNFETCGALLIFYSEELEAIQSSIVAAGGKITTEIFPFPGGRRFHFAEPSGNELAVWSDKGL